MSLPAAEYVRRARGILALPMPDELAARKIAALEYGQRPLHLLTVKEFCAVHGINRSTLFRWRKARRIKVIETVAGLRIEDAPFCNIRSVEKGEG
jgi:hypothetical protein